MITQIANAMAANNATMTNGCVAILDFKLLLFLFLVLLSGIIGLIMCSALKFHVNNNCSYAGIQTNNNCQCS